jgi:hypothetical protein
MALGYAGAGSSLASGNRLSRFSFGANDSEFACIEAFVDGTPGTNDYPGRLVFSTTADGSASPTERFRISSTGAQSSVIPGGSTLYPSFDCRAWVNFNGTGTVAIRASGNVSSITDNAAGDYTVNFTTAMPDGFWAASGICQLAINSSGRENFFVSLRRENNLSTTSARLSVQPSDTTTPTDAALVAVAFFR